MFWWTVWLALVMVLEAVPSAPRWFEQRADHFSASDLVYKQRYYMQDQYFGGPGFPIFMIMGGEGGIPPEIGLFYPWVTDVLSKVHRALVIQPEHRFYGESLPFGNASFSPQNLAIAMSTQQALADAAALIRSTQSIRNCTERGTSGYCPVLTIGGSYPGFMSAMMRLRYPAVVDMAHAASAPMRIYSQQVQQYEYYAKVTESAERSLQGCSGAVRESFRQLENFLSNATTDQVVEYFSLCSPVPTSELYDNLLFLIEQTFANLNMANYPPDSQTALHRACASFVEALSEGGSAPLHAMRSLLLTETRAALAGRRSGRAHLGDMVHPRQAQTECFDLVGHMPAGQSSTARCGDWSGCGSGRDGEMWDYQTCTFEVEQIGFGTSAQMFPTRSWTHEWLAMHCEKRFGIKPQPKSLVELWGFDEENLRAQTSRIVFTNGMNDGWSVGGFSSDLAAEKGLITINLPNGAHHSELSHTLDLNDTPDVVAAHQRIIMLVGGWLKEVQHADAEHKDQTRDASVNSIAFV